jgi:hypothetical protein
VFVRFEFPSDPSEDTPEQFEKLRTRLESKINVRKGLMIKTT